MKTFIPRANTFKNGKPGKVCYTIFCHNIFWVPAFWPHTHEKRNWNSYMCQRCHLAFGRDCVNPWQARGVEQVGSGAKRGTPSRPLSTCSTTFRQHLVLTHWKLLRWPTG